MHCLETIIAMNKPKFDPPEPPVEFVNDDEICEHDAYHPDCKECAEELELSLADLNHKDK